MFSITEALLGGLKYVLDRSTMHHPKSTKHPKFNLTRVGTHDLYTMDSTFHVPETLSHQGPRHFHF